MDMTRPPSSNQKPSNPWNQVGLAMSIPMLLLAGPLVGLGLGWLLNRWTHWGEWLQWVFMILGMIAGVREVIKVIRRMS
jgi:F0F1-type ATP synthase assembly protein I